MLRARPHFAGQIDGERREREGGKERERKREGERERE
jgi:hypothetical protein